MTSIELFSLPADVPPSLTGKTSVAVDVLRAGTTIITALGNGAAAIAPCVDIETTRWRASENDKALLGGERHGLLIDGFSLSNSPETYEPDVVLGRTIFFTTTNGTRAIEACRSAEEILIGSFVNLEAVCQHLVRSNRPVAIVCAGTNGIPTLEDNLFGGAICHWFAEKGSLQLNPAGRAASELWRTALRQVERGGSLGEILCQTQGGKNLVELDLSADIEFASRMNRYDFVPVCDPQKAVIRTDVDLAGAHR